jgi:type II secretory pathway pseudopilin PulG
MSAKPFSSVRRAFTIVELLVAVGVTAILVTLMVTITINVLNAWNRSSGTLTAGNQARLVLDQISQDLQGVIIRRDSNAWLVATVQRDQTQDARGDSLMPTAIWNDTVVKPAFGAGSLLVNPTVTTAVENPNFPLGIENYRFGQAGVWLRFFTTPPDNAQTGLNRVSAPRAVSYQLVRRRIGGASAANTERVYMLYRAEVRPAARADASPAGQRNSTFAAGYDLLMDENAEISYNRRDIVGGNVGNIRSPEVTYLIANDVIDFGIKLYGRDSNNAEVELFPVQRNANGSPIASVPTSAPFTFAVSNRPATSPAPNIAGVGPVTYGYPTAADVMVRILTPEGARLIRSIEQGTLQADWWDTAIQNSQVFTRRIEIKSKGL